MKASLFTVILGACTSLVAGQASLSSIPSCATSCGLTAIGQTDCAKTKIDTACVCNNAPFIEEIKSCAIKACSECDKRLDVYNFAVNLCKTVNISPNTTGFGEGCSNFPANYDKPQPGTHAPSGSSESGSASSTASGTSSTATGSSTGSAASASASSKGNNAGQNTYFQNAFVVVALAAAVAAL